MRERATIEPRFFETYHYADVITATVENQFDHLLLWDNFFCDGAVTRLLEPYQRESAFHTFIAYIIDDLLEEHTNEVDLNHHRALARLSRGIPEVENDLQPFVLPVERALIIRGFEFESFVDWLSAYGKTATTAHPDDIYHYLEDLRLGGPYEDLVAQSAREAFFTLFTNRTLLLRFNGIVSEHVQNLSKQPTEEELLKDVAHHFARPGVLRRAPMPEWVRRAIFFRDRGRCVACHSDLTGIVSLWSEENFDHMVPLARGGLNDVTNVQLLCAACNRRKAAGDAFTSGSYEDWYSMTERSKER